MEILQAITLGTIQGLTEFIPVSSSGHLVLTRILLGWEDTGVLFDVIMHLGTLAAAVIYFRRDILHALTTLTKPGSKTFARNIIIATIPAAAVGFLFGDAIESATRNATSAGSLLILLGAIFLLSEAFAPKPKPTTTTDKHPETTQPDLPSLTTRQSLFIGLAQIFALLPGISRSGITISAGILSGVSRATATRFTFLLSIPLIAGAGLKGLLDLADHGANGTTTPEFIIGFVAAAIVGYASIAFLLKYLRTHTLNIFAYYVIALGAITLLIEFLR